MELIMEFLFDLILEGSVELLPNRKVPMVLRVLAGVILLTVYGGLLVLGIALMIDGWQTQDWPLFAVGTFLWIFIAVASIATWRKANRRESQDEDT